MYGALYFPKATILLNGRSDCGGYSRYLSDQIVVTAKRKRVISETGPSSHPGARKKKSPLRKKKRNRSHPEFLREKKGTDRAEPPFPFADRASTDLPGHGVFDSI